MRHGLRFCLVVIGTAGFLGWIAGCATSSHTSVRTYEYSDERPERPTHDESDSEYQMQSPGEMVSPGTIVDDP
ncbi:MAG: hypothetical protein WBE26_01680 [Phycisphaerae bacterium]